jgi:psiF repeat
MRISSLVCALALGALVCGPALAFDAPAPASTASPGASPSAAPAMDAAAKAAKSSECYQQADAKDLHGKDRKTFHRECMKTP